MSGCNFCNEYPLALVDMHVLGYLTDFSQFPVPGDL